MNGAVSEAVETLAAVAATTEPAAATSGLCPFDVDWASLSVPTPSTCFGHWTEYALALAVACTLPIVRFVLDRTLFQAFLPLVLGKGTSPPKFFKAKESLWKFCVYVGLVALATWAVIGHPWFTTTITMWQGCTSVPCQAPALPKVKLLYAVEMGYYLQELPLLFMWHTRRKDFLGLVVHHIATLGLITYSLELGITRIGAVIYLLHDINDPFLEIAKVCRYSSRPQLEPFATLFFVGFVLSWFVTRVYYFPVVVIKSTLFEVMDIARGLGISIEPHYSILNFLLIVLLVLHVYWSYLILRIIYRQLHTGRPDDIREDSDSDEDESVQKQKKQ